MSRIAVYPGSFDPITNGHTDLIRRACRLFDTVIFAIGVNARKKALFSLDERIALSGAVLKEFPNVKVMGFKTLVVEFAAQMQAQVILRGLRAVSDYEFELQLASTNRRLNTSIDTVFLTPAEEHLFVSSTLVKEIASYGGDISSFCHPLVQQALMQRLSRDGT